jgi:hypothetical protein
MAHPNNLSLLRAFPAPDPALSSTSNKSFHHSGPIPFLQNPISIIHAPFFPQSIRKIPGFPYGNFIQPSPSPLAVRGVPPLSGGTPSPPTPLSMGGVPTPLRFHESGRWFAWSIVGGCRIRPVPERGVVPPPSAAWGGTPPPRDHGRGGPPYPPLLVREG